MSWNFRRFDALAYTADLHRGRDRLASYYAGLRCDRTRAIAHLSLAPLLMTVAAQGASGRRQQQVELQEFRAREGALSSKYATNRQRDLKPRRCLVPALA